MESMACTSLNSMLRSNFAIVRAHLRGVLRRIALGAHAHAETNR